MKVKFADYYIANTDQDFVNNKPHFFGHKLLHDDFLSQLMTRLVINNSISIHRHLSRCEQRGGLVLVFRLGVPLTFTF